jgi:hypothetical protein
MTAAGLVARGRRRCAFFALVRILVDTNNSCSKPATITDQNKILQTSTEALNLGRLSLRSSAGRPQVMRLLCLGTCTGGHKYFLQHVGNNNRPKQNSPDEHRSIEPWSIVATIVDESAAGDAPSLPWYVYWWTQI